MSVIHEYHTKKSPPRRGGPGACGGGLWILKKKTSRGGVAPGGFPEISPGQMVDWTWPWKKKALHMQWVALLAP